MPNSKARFIILKIVIAVMFAAVIWKLFDLQVLKGEQYYEIANDRMTTNIVEKAPVNYYVTAVVSTLTGKFRSSSPRTKGKWVATRKNNIPALRTR